MTFRRISTARYQANREVGSGEAQIHAFNVQACHDRPRPLFIGPHPEIGINGELSPSWHEKFVRIDGSTGATETTIEAGAIFPSAPGSSIRILANWIPFHHTPQNSIDEDSNPDQSYCEWNIKGYAEKFNTGAEGWDSVGSSSSLINFGHYANSASNVFPVLLSEQLRIRYAVGATPQFIYREGQLYLSDLALIRRSAVTVDLGSWDADEPLRFRLTAERDTAAGDIIWNNEANNNVSALYLMLVSLSVWEIA